MSVNVAAEPREPAPSSAPGRTVAAWFGLAGSLVGLVYVVAVLALGVRDVLGRGVAAVLCGGRLVEFQVRPDLSGWSRAAGVAEWREGIVAWAGIAAQVLVGGCLWLLAGRGRARSPWRSAVAVMGVVLVAIGLGQGLLGAALGRGPVGETFEEGATATRLAAALASGALLVAALAWSARRAVVAIDGACAPRNATAWGTAFVGVLLLPLAVLGTAMSRPSDLGGGTRAALVAGLLAVLAAFAAARGRRPPADPAASGRRRVRGLTGAAWLVLATGVGAAMEAYLVEPVRVEWPARERAGLGLFTEPERFAPRWASIDVVAAVVSAPFPVSQPAADAREQLARFVEGVGGEPVLLHGSNGAFRVRGRDLRPVASVSLPAGVRDVVRLPGTDGSSVWVSLVWVEGDPLGRWEVVATDEGGARRWSWTPREVVSSRPLSLALLTDAEGAYGVAICDSRAQTITALDPAGRTLWARAFPYARSVRTARGLPGTLLVCSLFEARSWRHDRHGVTEELGPDRPFWPTSDAEDRRLLDDACLFRGHDGERCVVLVTRRQGEPGTEERQPRLTLFGADGGARWHAWLPARTRGLGVASTPSVDLIVVATVEGDLFVLDDDGALRGRERVPPGDVIQTVLHGERNFGTSGLAVQVGEVGPRAWAAAVTVRWGTFVYGLDPSALSSSR